MDNLYPEERAMVQKHIDFFEAVHLKIKNKRERLQNQAKNQFKK